MDLSQLAKQVSGETKATETGPSERKRAWAAVAAAWGIPDEKQAEAEAALAAYLSFDDED